MSSRQDMLHRAALEYVELQASAETLATDLATLRRTLITGLHKGEGVEVDANTVLTVVDRPQERKAITQKALHEAGVPQVCVDKLLRATKPPANAPRVHTLKLVLLSVFEATRERAASSGGAGVGKGKEEYMQAEAEDEN